MHRQRLRPPQLLQHPRSTPRHRLTRHPIPAALLRLRRTHNLRQTRLDILTAQPRRQQINRRLSTRPRHHRTRIRPLPQKIRRRLIRQQLRRIPLRQRQQPALRTRPMRRRKLIPPLKRRTLPRKLRHPPITTVRTRDTASQGTRSARAARRLRPVSGKIPARAICGRLRARRFGAGGRRGRGVGRVALGLSGVSAGGPLAGMLRRVGTPGDTWDHDRTACLKNDRLRETVKVRSRSGVGAGHGFSQPVS